MATHVQTLVQDAIHLPHPGSLDFHQLGMLWRLVLPEALPCGRPMEGKNRDRVGSPDLLTSPGHRHVHPVLAVQTHHPVAHEV